MESMIMSKRVSVIQLAAGNPVGSPGSIVVYVGSTVIWSTTSKEYPKFEIEFVDSVPPSTGNDLSGSVNRPVAIVLSKEDEGDFPYNIKHIKKDKTCVSTGPFPFSVMSDPGGGFVRSGQSNDSVKSDQGGDVVRSGQSNDSVMSDPGGDVVQSGQGNDSVKTDPGGDGAVAFFNLPTDQEIDQATADQAAVETGVGAM
jgi:hypothetical protein